MKSGKKKIHWPRVFLLIVFLSIIIAISFTFGKSVLEGKKPTLLSFASINLAGYLFFITLPVEVLIPYYLFHNFNPFLVFTIAMVTALISQSIDYGIGHIFPKDYIKEMIGEKRYKNSVKKVKKHGDKVIFIFNLFPLSSPIIMLAAGIMGYKYKKAILIICLGLKIKYLFLILVF